MGKEIGSRQEQNIMILFLSDVKYEDMDGKIIDGKSAERRTAEGKTVKDVSPQFKHRYIFHDGRQDIKECSLTNEAPIRDVVNTLRLQGKTLDKIFYFCTASLKEGPIRLQNENDSYETHEALFKKRIQMLCEPDLAHTDFIDIPFDIGNSNPMEECLNAVVAMAKKIEEFVPRDEMENVHLFADVTGGLRTANMTMTAVMQLLQYEHVNLDLVLYSDGHLVSDVHDITGLYKLVAGVDAFTEYGRSDAIEKYFGFEFSKDGKENAPKSKLEELLVSMHRFADAMSLCWPDHIIRSLNDLIDVLDAFPSESSNPKEKLLIQLLPTIRKKYDSLLIQSGGAREIDRLAVIEWCVKNNLIQPALTLCTEWLPDYMADYGAVYTDDPAILHYCRKDIRKDGDRCGYKAFYRDFCVNLPTNGDMTSVFPAEPVRDKKPKKTALQRIMEISARMKLEEILDSKGTRTDVDRPFQIFDPSFGSRLSQFLRSIPQRLKERHPVISKNKEELKFQDVFRQLVDWTVAPPPGSKRFGKPREKVTEEDIYARLREHAVWLITQFNNEKEGKQYPFHVENVSISADDDISRQAEKISLEMLRCGMMKTVLSKPDKSPAYEKAAEYIRRYTNIRANIRNSSLHAVDTKKSKKKVPESFTEVKRDLEECLALVRELANNESAREHKARYRLQDASKEAATP